VDTSVRIVTTRPHIDRALVALRESEHWPQLDARARDLGFSRWTFTAVPACAGPHPRGPLRVTSYPRDYVAEGSARGLYDANPGFAYAMQNTAPISYGSVRTYLPHTPRVRAYLELNRRFGVTRGVLLPIADALGARALLGLAFAGSERELLQLWHDARESVQTLGAETNRAILRDHLQTFARDLLPRLTPRQREMLQLLAEGDTVGAAAERLRVSIHTADKHLAAARRALHAETTAHAVALAVRFQILE
jgi:LuxR family transcriptional regulator